MDWWRYNARIKQYAKLKMKYGLSTKQATSTRRINHAIQETLSCPNYRERERECESERVSEGERAYRRITMRDCVRGLQGIE